jgi:hypothetical protein
LIVLVHSGGAVGKLVSPQFAFFPGQSQKIFQWKDAGD